jgi:D-alanyl-D-alanine dipeptidase
MQAIRVQYTVRDDYAETNAARVQAVMDELRATGQQGIQYTCFRVPDTATFIHLVVLEREELKGVVPGLAAFKVFREGLRENAVSPPDNQPLGVIGTSYDL